ncbi:MULTISPECIES: acetyl-CoA carboxylase biotin carboxyl carrier protein subunit [Enterococcus]|uniref:Acetyl-CoA carboxylase biotin carboxyl carrier protein subunit n=1 Tax=Enterococcus dispar ATCC 51266 TaxID=1139219 RepID=S0KFN0_9ENTE|nr:acetyl-CoA carboxylase biotin carboxyl carrier protein subunit [Enterococcus dispar]EOT38973.1 acetyl-CoA carboxylase biotin carboxyl carrier protein subunit [Enterococcus dispar ATCC 51266]EOW86126.1 acetyl-CoA carboxylase biotin carboxyl carrier protein subunit [Enterococcus dispar ATCC 51266]MDT2705149.1 acetyl-CoA carboxylase biotin carboxyl carrier protein subunit [Enterococcus dispar]WCG32409.1 acetyl-CoA carboxylase biotin carboxyl carrier protein subunit [Enterococcus dispar]
MLRKFKITIDGTEYLVEMEEIGGVPQPAAPVATPQQPVAPAPTATVAPVATPASADAMTAPMPGTILKVLVNVGDEVQENQPVMILEAMKMENEVVAPKAGKVTGIHVTQGQMVNPGEALITFG